MFMFAHDVSMAARNLMRNWRRTTGTMLALTIGTVMLLLFGGFTNGIMAVQETGIVGTTGQIHIQRQGYGVYGFGNPTSYSIDDIGPLVNLLQSDHELKGLVQMYTPLLLFNGLISRYDTGGSHIMNGEGVVPSDQNQLRKWNGYQLAYNPNAPIPLASNDSNVAIIGTGLARMLGYCKELHVDDCDQSQVAPVSEHLNATDKLPSDISTLAQGERSDHPARVAGPSVDLLTATPDGAPNVVNVAVAHAENQGVSALNSTYVGIPLARARRLVFGAAAKQQATFLVVQLKHTADTARVKDYLNQIFGRYKWPYYAADFTQYFPEYVQIKMMFRTIFGFIAILMSIIVLFTTSNTMGTSVVERTVEIGTLRAMGSRSRSIEFLFLCEGALLGIGGVALGVVLSLVAAWLVTHSGITWAPPGRSEKIPLMISLWGDFSLMAETCLSLFLVAILSSWAPARRASRRNIVEALRHV